MKTRIIRSIALLAGLAAFASLSASLAQGLALAKEAPDGATVVEAFSKQHAMCEGLTEWAVGPPSHFGSYSCQAAGWRYWAAWALGCGISSRRLQEQRP
ncbi:MAG: hypothetical protein PVF77_12070 [Anaerolineae bacterium]